MCARPAARHPDRYLRSGEPEGLLRVIVCGGANNGASTLIGRLVHESGTSSQDRLGAWASKPPIGEPGVPIHGARRIVSRHRAGPGT